MIQLEYPWYHHPSRGVSDCHNSDNKAFDKRNHSQSYQKSQHPRHQSTSNNSSSLSFLEYLKVSAIVSDFCYCNCGDLQNFSEPNEVTLPRDTSHNPTLTMPSNKKSSRSSSANDWTSWMSSFSSLFEQEKPKLPQHQLRHTSSSPTSHRHISRREREENQHRTSQFLKRSSSYALKRTGTLNNEQPSPCSQVCDFDDESGLQVVPTTESPCWSPPPRRIQVEPPPTKRQSKQPPPNQSLKRVSFSSIQIYASATESLSPSSSLTSSTSRYALDSPRDPPPVTISIDAFEAKKPTDLNPIPYHLRYSPPPEMPGKEELRHSDSLLDSGKRKKFRPLKWTKRSFWKSSRKDIPIEVVDATDPKYSKHINMAGIVMYSQRV